MRLWHFTPFLLALLVSGCAERLTTPVDTVSPTIAPNSASTTFNQRGKASFYARMHHGQRTANGETHDQNSLVAAHRSLPFGTRVKVTNLSNGKQVIVRINDRGPFVRGRIIDLSQAAARRIGMLEQGVARVRIEALE